MTSAERDDGPGKPPAIAARDSIPELWRPWCVDVRDRSLFLYAYLRNVSELGLFIPTRDPAPVGACLELILGLDAGETLRMAARVQWVNPWRPGGDNLNPGMGVLFGGLGAEQRERLVEAIRTIAYLR